jgi:hypothetical protein
MPDRAHSPKQPIDQNTQPSNQQPPVAIRHHHLYEDT